MKRIILSILCGIFFPILYTVLIVTTIESVFPQYEGLLSMKVAGRASFGLILAPVAIPVWMYDCICSYNYFGLWYFLDTVWFRVTLIIGLNLFLYSGLFYGLFRYLGLFKRSNPQIDYEPPPPPRFAG